MTGRARGARRGRGWDAAPPSAAAAPPSDPAPGQDRARGRAAGRAGGSDRAGGGGDRPSLERDPAEFARDICLRQLAARPRTRAELARALRGKGVPDDVAEPILERYAEVGMIDDAAFAQAWVTSRHQGRGLARRALVQELRQRGVSTDDAAEALSGLDTETETTTARALVRRRLRAVARLEYQAAFRRLVSMLARKGYPAGIAVAVVREELAAVADEAGAWDGVEAPDDDAWDPAAG
ncbi:hypothetical protein GCM10010124_20100 [Pilimelia terevasa]|uniref:Regulatory protein RecX n=1 Tax=Pilimelia terevasa TaxID=53372 RepID=A0A8J3BNP7_9ACTN|nr:regulatory protein RecX [Pilimelia terevasa]GGK27503.1 hypothetical protein GCM10010124_20100 [Pilimelia terevasa]